MPGHPSMARAIHEWPGSTVGPEQTATNVYHTWVRGRKAAKGMRKVLEERGLWRPGKKLKPDTPILVPLELTLTGLCLQCQIDNPNTHRKSKRVSYPECLLGGDCCAVAILSAQEDFRSAHSHLQEIVKGARHIFLLYPKFHCELNWIEYNWVRCKYFTRKHCNYTLAGTVAYTSSPLADGIYANGWY